MELIDTPNPNAKKINLNIKKEEIPKSFYEIKGISSIFVGPGFITLTKEEDVSWESITEDISNNFDKL